MNCSACRRELEIGDEYIRDTPSAFMGQPDAGFDGLMAEILGGTGGEVIYCDDCTEDGGQWIPETFYGDEEDV